MRSMAAVGTEGSSIEHLGETKRLSEMLSPSLRSLLDGRRVDVLIPLGALEQHGPHLPLGTDSIIADAVAVRVVERVPDLLIGPAVTVGCSDHHLGFAGTASVQTEQLATTLTSIVTTLLGHGFRHAYLFSGHAGNIPSMQRSMAELPSELEGRASAFTDWPGQRAALHDWGQTRLGLTPEEIGSHAGHFETSMMLVLAPQRVDMDAAPVGYVGSSEEGSRIMRSGGMRRLSQVGVMGDARSASAEAGEGYLEVMTGTVVDFIEGHRRRVDG